MTPERERAIRHELADGSPADGVTWMMRYTKTTRELLDALTAERARAERAEQLSEQAKAATFALLDELTTILSAVVPTPERGYRTEPALLFGDVKEVTAALARAEAERDTFHSDRDNWRDTARRYAEERDEAQASNEALLDKLDVLSRAHSGGACEGSCACSFDKRGDVCEHHSPALMREKATVAALRGALERVKYCAESHTVAKADRRTPCGWGEVYHFVDAVLTAPDPGAPYRAVVEAAREAREWIANEVGHPKGIGDVAYAAKVRKELLARLDATLPAPRPAL